MSCACGRRSIGNVCAKSSGSRSQPVTSCGDTDEVAQVSITSGSPTKPPGWPRCASRVAVGHVGGRIDRQPRLVGHEAPRRSRSSRRRAAAYQTGNGTPKKRWRLTHQSPFRPCTQFSKRARMYSGCHCSSRPRASSPSLCSMVLKNHCRLVTISSGRSPFSKNFTWCVIGRGAPEQIAGRGEQLDDLRLRLLRRQAAQLVVGRLRRRRRRRLPPGAAPASPGRACRWAGSRPAPAASARATR